MFFSQRYARTFCEAAEGTAVSVIQFLAVPHASIASARRARLAQVDGVRSKRVILLSQYTRHATLAEELA